MERCIAAMTDMTDINVVFVELWKMIFFGFFEELWKGKYPEQTPGCSFVLELKHFVGIVPPSSCNC